MILKIEIPKFVLTQGDQKNLRVALRISGAEVVATARALVRNAGGSGAYHNGHYASAVGEPPASLTGELSRSIKSKAWTKSGVIGVTISDTVYYAKFLETGAEGGGPQRRNTRANKRKGTSKVVNSKRILQPRPFISTALDSKRDAIDARVRDAVVADLELKED